MMADKKEQAKANTPETKKKGMWVPQFNKYIDDLTEEEWEMMANSSCGDVNSNCEENDFHKEKK